VEVRFDDLEKTIASIDQSLKALTAEGRKQLPRRGSRFVDQGADPSLVETIAKGGSYTVHDNAASIGNGPRGDQRGLAALLIERKAMAEGTGTAGGFLVPPEFSEEIVKLLRARSAVMALGPRIVAVKKELDVTSISSGSSAAYVAENAPIPVSEMTFAQQALLRPKELAALVPISNRLLRDAVDSPDVEQVIREDLAEVLALRADLAFIEGTGTGGEPKGIRNTAGTTSGPSFGTNGRTPTFDDLKAVVASLRALNAPFMRPGWLFHPRLLATLETVKDTTGRYLADSDLLTFDAIGGGGTLLGFPFRTSGQIPTNITTGSSSDTSYIIFSSDWQEAWVGENETLTIEVSAEAAYDAGSGLVSAFQNNQSLFRAIIAHDFALRRPQLFVVMTGVRP
jgi:HK97 family phage major capsid protein